jgi:GTPase
MKFVDIVSVTLKGGDGGSGCVSFRREKFVPKGGPDGGNGGRGGNVILRASRHLSTLLDFHYHDRYQAPRGQHGMGSSKTGASGDDVLVGVPVGTLVRDTSGGEILADLVDDGQSFVAAHGGRGGRGNAEFATSTNQAPRHYEPGERGEEITVELELKLLADVGLVGLPNAGKSTLISVISAARPKIADYPFTTLVPNLGIVRVADNEGFVVADIPGLIEGAHTGKGLGIQFLRHIERSGILVYLLEATRMSLKEDYQTLRTELKAYDPALIRKRSLIAITKIDTIAPPERRKLKAIKFGRTPVFLISAVSGAGIPELVHAMGDAVRKKKSPSRKS